MATETTERTDPNPSPCFCVPHPAHTDFTAKWDGVAGKTRLRGVGLSVSVRSVVSVAIHDWTTSTDHPSAHGLQ